MRGGQAPGSNARNDYQKYQQGGAGAGGGGGLKMTNNTSPGNPMVPTRYTEQPSNNQNRDWMSENLVSRYQNAGSGGGLKPGNDSSIGNPLNNYRPDYLQKHAEANKQVVAQQPYKQSGVKASGGEGLRPGNDSSSQNPLNNYRQDYLQSHAEKNKEIVSQNPYKMSGNPNQGGGGIRPGNDSSSQNPLNNYRQDYLDHFVESNKQVVAQQPFKPTRGAAAGPTGAGGLVKGNHTSDNNPLNVAHNTRYGEKNYYYQDDNDAGAEKKMHSLAQEMARGGRSYDPYAKSQQSQPQQVDPYDPYSGLTPKQRLEAKRRDHYQQGSIPTTSSPVGARGGVSGSNETSSGNPLLTHDPRMLEYYKQTNKQMVQQDPIKKGNRARGGANTGFVGGFGGGGGGGSDMPMKGPANNGPSDDGVVKKRGGIAMNL